MQKIKCIIIEDEPLAARLLTGYIEKVPHLQLCGSFRDAISAGNFLLHHTIDLIFLDIHLPKLKGFSFLRTLATKPAIIVTTAYHQYAVEGFELNVVDYLMKPFSLERFLAAVHKLAIATPANLALESEAVKKDKALFLTIDRKKVRIGYDNILYIESRREYVKVVTLHGEYLSKISTTEIELLLPKTIFTRIHRSFIVAIDRIDSYSKTEVEIRGTTIPIGKGYKNDIIFGQ